MFKRRTLMKYMGTILAGFLLFEPCGRLVNAQEQTPVQAVQTEDRSLLANFLTVVNIPARAALCGANSLLAAIVMGASAGRRYADAATMIEEGCAGPWVITPEMIEQEQELEKYKASGELAQNKPD
jgi:hypothetical protein